VFYLVNWSKLAASMPLLTATSAFGF